MPQLPAPETKVISEKIKTIELTWELQSHMHYGGGIAALSAAHEQGKKSCDWELIVGQARFRTIEDALIWGADRAWDPTNGQRISL